MYSDASTSQTLTGGDVLFLLQRERQESNLHFSLRKNGLQDLGFVLPLNYARIIHIPNFGRLRGYGYFV